MTRCLRPVVSLALLVMLGSMIVACVDRPHGVPLTAVVPTDNGVPRFVGERFVRTELFFGTARPDGSVVTEAAFQRFVTKEITPRFPDGLTLLTGLGQFRHASGTIMQERSMLLILLYPETTWQDSSIKIEQIRAAYKRAFQQESVLRTDRCCELVGF